MPWRRQHAEHLRQRPARPQRAEQAPHQARNPWCGRENEDRTVLRVQPRGHLPQQLFLIQQVLIYGDKHEGANGARKAHFVEKARVHVEPLGSCVLSHIRRRLDSLVGNLALHQLRAEGPPAGSDLDHESRVVRRMEADDEISQGTVHVRTPAGVHLGIATPVARLAVALSIRLLQCLGAWKSGKLDRSTTRADGVVTSRASAQSSNGPRTDETGSDHVHNLELAWTSGPRRRYFAAPECWRDSLQQGLGLFPAPRPKCRARALCRRRPHR